MTQLANSKPAQPFDGAQLERRVYLTSAEAAWYCGFTEQDYKSAGVAMDCFRAWVRDRGIPKAYVGRSLRFFRRDLDRALRGGVE
jgi:hypothetical protein